VPVQNQIDQAAAETFEKLVTVVKARRAITGRSWVVMNDGQT
jgi:hypothetical protein